jgi:Mlc titration factor MtfA (ptsG expression regulator)
MNGKAVLKGILDRKFSEVHFDTPEQLQEKFPFLRGRQIFCKFDLQEISILTMMILKVQGNHVYYEEVK